MGTKLLGKGFLNFIKVSHLINRLSIIRAAGLEVEAPDGAMLGALGPDIITWSMMLNWVKHWCHQEDSVHSW